MSTELLNTSSENNKNTLEDQLSLAKKDLFECFLECIWEKSENWTRILAMFWIVLAHFDKEALGIGKNDLNEFISSFLREMEIDEVNIRKFHNKYLKYLLYKTSKDMADRVIEKLNRKERSI